MINVSRETEKTSSTRKRTLISSCSANNAVSSIETIGVLTIADVENLGDNMFGSGESSRLSLPQQEFKRPIRIRMYLSKITIHVFQGGEYANQSIPFLAALTPFQRCGKFNFEIVFMTCKLIKEKKWTIKEFIDWLLDCDLHFILTHIHQGVANHLDWNMVDLYHSLLRLQAHNGFPNGTNLQCPMFTQDKYEYLRLLIPLKFANPTMKIYFNASGQFNNIRPEIERYFWFQYFYITTSI